MDNNRKDELRGLEEWALILQLVAVGLIIFCLFFTGQQQRSTLIVAAATAFVVSGLYLIIHIKFKRDWAIVRCTLWLGCGSYLLVMAMV